MDEWMHAWVEDWMEAWMDRWIIGWMDFFFTMLSMGVPSWLRVKDLTLSLLWCRFDPGLGTSTCHEGSPKKKKKKKSAECEPVSPKETRDKDSCHFANPKT